MSEVAERYGRIADTFTERLRGVPAGSWSCRSPCPEWTAYDVAKHVIATHRSILTRLTGGDPTAPDSGEDLLASWQVESDAIRSALADPQRAATQVRAMTGEQSFETLVGTLLCADTLLHTWDLARATGQDDRLDPDGVEAARAMLEPNDEMLRVPGGFGPKIEPGEGADAQARLLNFAGRRP